MTSVWFKWRSAIRRKQKSCYSLSLSLPSFSLSLRPPPTTTTSIQLKYVTITEWQFDTQWPVRTFISQCFILVRSQTAEKISKLFQGLEWDQTFLASSLTRPLIYNGSVRGWLDSVCLKTYRCSTIAQALPFPSQRAFLLFVWMERISQVTLQNLTPCKWKAPHAKLQAAAIKPLRQERSHSPLKESCSSPYPVIFLVPISITFSFQA